MNIRWSIGKRPAKVGALLALLAGVTWASSASAHPTSGAALSQRHASLSLNVVVASGNPQFGAVYVAQAEGLFAKNGLEVNLNPAGLAATNSLLTSGKDDIAFFTVVQPLLLAKQGLDTRIIASASFNEIPMMIGAPNVTSLSDIKRGDCAIGGVGPGNEYFELSLIANMRLGLNCRYVQLGLSFPVVVSAVASGRVQAGVVTPTFGVPAVQAKQATTLIDPLHATPQEEKIFFPHRYPALVAYGLNNTLVAKRAAVVRFLKSLYEAGQLISKMTPQQLAQLTVSKLGTAFPGATVDGLVVPWSAAKAVLPLGKNRGDIDPHTWKDTFKNINGWGVGSFDRNDSALSYNARIDMSYWKAATGHSTP